MCVDYRGLNARTVKDAYPLPRIDESLDALGGAAIFSTMDLQSAYYQVEIAEEDKAKTAFTTPAAPAMRRYDSSSSSEDGLLVEECIRSATSPSPLPSPAASSEERIVQNSSSDSSEPIPRRSGRQNAGLHHNVNRLPRSALSHSCKVRRPESVYWL